jgi:hypothetical protein
MRHAALLPSGLEVLTEVQQVDQIFPDNFMMLAGDASSRTCPYIQGKKARDLPVNYLCLGDPNDGKNDYDPTYSQFPPVDCSGKIRMQIKLVSFAHEAAIDPSLATRAAGLEKLHPTIITLRRWPIPPKQLIAGPVPTATSNSLGSSWVSRMSWTSAY